MASSDKPFWTLLTSFDAGEIQTAFKLEGAKYTRPAMLRFPEVFSDVLLSSGSSSGGGRAFDELHALLLGKMQQLTEMGDSVRWKSSLDEFVKILGASMTQQVVEMSIYEATRVQMVCINRQLETPHADLDTNSANLVQGLARGLVRIAQFPPLVGPMVSFLLNKSEFIFVFQNLEPAQTTNLLLNAGRILAMFGANDMMNAAEGTQLAQTWHTIISPFFEATTSKRRHDGFTTLHARESSRTRCELQHMFASNKLPKLQTFLISYFAHLYTQALAARGRTHLRIYAPYTKLFNGLSLQLAHFDALEEMLTVLLERGIALVPHSPTLLRTKADFSYVRNQLHEAGIVYCELLVACKASLAMPIEAGAGGGGEEEQVVDESVWNHLRICLRAKQQQTLAAAVCQLFKTGRAKEFRKAAEAVQERPCLDASDDCFGLIYDIQLAEALTDAYKKRGEQQKLDALLDVISSPTMNPNNSTEVLEREMRRKQRRLLNAMAAMHFNVHS